MLAYVFSHRPAPAVEKAAYEDMLRRFHSSLADGRPPGFVRSLSYRIGDGYSDWYLVQSSAALDTLNEAAVTGARAARHDEVARIAVDGVGKLLSHVAGEPDLEARFEVRFAKPTGMDYEHLYGLLERWTAMQGTSLWRRMMVLGPPPEFCLVSPSTIVLPAEMRPETVERHRL